MDHRTSVRLITGSSGAGKSYLAQALGLNACRNGFSVQCVRLPTLLPQFVQARAQGTYDRLLKRLSKLSRLVIDDFGLAALSEIERQDLLEAIEERYGTGATLVTSQLPVGDWHEYLGGGRIADAILDRLVHHAAGFADAAHLTRTFRKMMGIAPSFVRIDWRRGACTSARSARPLDAAAPADAQDSPSPQRQEPQRHASSHLQASLRDGRAAA